MTWGEFKAGAEAQGLKDDTPINFIDMSQAFGLGIVVIINEYQEAEIVSD